MSRHLRAQAVAAILTLASVSCVTVQVDAKKWEVRKFKAAYATETFAPYIQVLGTAQDGGLPQMGCRLDCCRAAHEEPSLRRRVTSLLLVDPKSSQRWLFDASPQLPLQVEDVLYHGRTKAETNGRPPLFDGVFLTHGHMGHYTGLMQFGREAYGSDPVQTIGTPRMLDFLQSNEPWKLLFDADHLRPAPIAADIPKDLGGGISVTAVSVPHRAEFTDTVGFVIRTPELSAFYLPDIDRWDTWERSLVDVIESVDFAFLDGTFFDGSELPGRDLSKIPHPFIVTTLAALADESAELRNKVYFTHLNHSNPAAMPGSEARGIIEAAGCHVLEEGQMFPLGEPVGDEERRELIRTLIAPDES